MAATRFTYLAVLCLCVGCHSVDRHACQREPTEAMLASAHTAGPQPAHQADDPHRPVRTVAWSQPAAAAAESEPLDTPAPEPDELTLEQLELMAMNANPALAEAQARLDATRGKWVQVGLPPNTVLGFSGQQLFSGGQAEQEGLFIQQEVVRGGKLRLNRAVVAQEIAQAEQLLALQRQRVLTDVRLGFYDVLIAQRRREMTEQIVSITRQGVTTAEALFNAKEVGQADVMRARIELQSAELLHKNARNLYDAAWSRLAAVLGNSNVNPTRLSGDLEDVVDQIDADEALQRLLAESPEIAAALTEVERARWGIARACAEPIPNLDVQAVVQNDNGTGSSNANLQVSMPIPWLNANQGGIRQAEAELIAAERAVERLELSLQRRLAAVFQRYASARNQVEDYAKPEGILANTQATLEFVRKGYQAGEIGYLDLLTAQRTYSETNLAYIEALGELWAAALEIDGLLLKDSLESVGSPGS